MALVSKSEAARLAGVSRTTIHRKIKDGQLSATSGKVDTAELIRVFGEISDSDGTVSSNVKSEQPVTPQNDPLLQQLLAEKDKRIDALEKDRDHWRDLAEDQNVKLLSHEGNTGPQPAYVLIAVVVTALLLASVVFLAMNSV